jgi:propanol-preferring alcohol dehydrogenase
MYINDEKRKNRSSTPCFCLLFLKRLTMMKAAVVTSFTEPLEIKQVPIPQLGPNDILVKNISCGVCHSDLHLAKGGNK